MTSIEIAPREIRGPSRSEINCRRHIGLKIVFFFTDSSSRDIEPCSLISCAPPPLLSLCLYSLLFDHLNLIFAKYFFNRLFIDEVTSIEVFGSVIIRAYTLFYSISIFQLKFQF